VTQPLVIRGLEFGGSQPRFCIPLVAQTLEQLLAQARIAHGLNADIVEWRADSYDAIAVDSVVNAAQELRSVLDQQPIIFTLRTASEGGAKVISQGLRAQCFESVLQSNAIDIVDVELNNEARFVENIVQTAHRRGTYVMLSFHDFEMTPSNDALLGQISLMVGQEADIAKIACMPREPEDVLRLLQVTLSARRNFPDLPLCTTSMGSLGSVSRVAGFLFGSDMAFAVGQEKSASGQIPIEEARAITALLLRNL